MLLAAWTGLGPEPRGPGVVHGYEINQRNKRSHVWPAGGHITQQSHPLQSGPGPMLEEAGNLESLSVVKCPCHSLRPDSWQSAQARAKQPPEVRMPITPPGLVASPTLCFQGF